MTVARGLGPWVLQPSAGRAKLLRSCASQESAARRSFESLPASRSNGSALEAARRPECPVLTPSPAPLERRAVSWQERRGTLPVSLTGRPTSKSGFAAGSNSRMGAQPLPRQYWGGSRWRLRTRRASRNAPPANARWDEDDGAGGSDITQGVHVASGTPDGSQRASRCLSARVPVCCGKWPTGPQGFTPRQKTG